MRNSGLCNDTETTRWSVTHKYKIKIIVTFQIIDINKLIFQKIILHLRFYMFIILLNKFLFKYKLLWSVIYKNLFFN